MLKKFRYIFNSNLHCGKRHGVTFCIVGPGHFGKHWDGNETEWEEK